jgi:protein-L-isoaspartate(D-aspartate) O-methyltransferase
MEAARAGLLRLLADEISNPEVLAVMARVPRELFVPHRLRRDAYADRPLPIGRGQTISQPYIVALMTQALELKPTDKVLEIGTGSGYQTAILAELAATVVSVERVDILRQQAAAVLKELDYANIELYAALPERLGWPLLAPYDAIVVTAAPPDVPPELVAQLKIGGRLVIPVGPRQAQQLVRLTRTQGQPEIEYLGGCAFVPLIGPQAWPEGR